MLIRWFISLLAGYRDLTVKYKHKKRNETLSTSVISNKHNDFIAQRPTETKAEYIVIWQFSLVCGCETSFFSPDAQIEGRLNAIIIIMAAVAGEALDLSQV